MPGPGRARKRHVTGDWNRWRDVRLDQALAGGGNGARSDSASRREGALARFGALMKMSAALWRHWRRRAGLVIKNSAYGLLIPLPWWCAWLRPNCGANSSRS